MESHEHYAILVEVSRVSGVEMRILGECVERRILPSPKEAGVDELELAARRVRRLLTLGLNMAGLETVLPLRQRYAELLREHQRMRRELEALRAQWHALSAPSLPQELEGDVVDEQRR